ncbi:MAG: site-specific integrase, partial [Victivallales bacterium]|nr:site-specific integrase [Victivallales bacterium]
MNRKPYIGTTKTGVWFVACFPDEGSRFQKSIGPGEESQHIAEEIKELLIQGALTPEEFHSWDAADKNWENRIQVVRERQRQTMAEAGEFFEEDEVTPSSPSLPQEAQATHRDGSATHTLKDAVEGYIRDMAARDVSRQHIANVHRVALKHIYPAFGEDTPIYQIGYSEDILPWINGLRNGKSPRKSGKRAPATVSRYCCMLRAIFNFAVMEGWIVASPMRRWRKPKEKPRRFMLTKEDAVKIMEHCSEHTRWAMEVCFNLGLRPGPSELLALRYEAVNFEKGTVTVYARKTKTFREIPVKKEFLDHLREKKKESKQGFIIEYDGKPVKSIHRSFRRAVQRAGITYPVCLYDLRHMFGTFMLAAGADLSAVSQLMGHHSVKMTADTYYQYMRGEKERAITLLPPLIAEVGNPTESQRV